WIACSRVSLSARAGPDCAGRDWQSAETGMTSIMTGNMILNIQTFPELYRATSRTVPIIVSSMEINQREKWREKNEEKNGSGVLHFSLSIFLSGWSPSTTR